MADINDKKAPGPKPDNLMLDNENWEEAVKKALGKKKPKEGWPDKPDKDENKKSE